ncbi:MAG: lytic transglycosylase domain-containing protein [Alphaproteobacteria bacterium]
MIKFVRATSTVISTAAFFLSGCGSSSALVDMEVPKLVSGTDTAQIKPAALDAESGALSHPDTTKIIDVAFVIPDAAIIKEPPVSESLFPPILSANDAERYRLIFAMQEKGDFKTADKIIATLQDRELLGHALAQRYLHPVYRSSYAELASWMEKYAELPDSRQIYELAVKRRGAKAETKGARLPQPSGRIWATDLESERPSLETPPAVAARKPAAEKLAIASTQKIQERLARGWIEGAQETIKSASAMGVFNTLETDFWQARTALAAFLSGDDRRALSLAQGVITRSQNNIPLAHWVAGLTAWRQKNYEEAQRRFTVVAAHQNLSSWDRAAGAYWSGRVADKRGNHAESVRYFKQAAMYPRTFYGQLARYQMNLDMGLTLTIAASESSPISDLVSAARAARAFALLQIGQKDRAERELRMFANEAPVELLSPLAVAVEKAGMPAVALYMGQSANLRESGLADALAYPLPPYRPRNGFTVDRALLFALMRQESAFRPDARSKVGARGLMQLMPATARSMAKRAGIADYELEALDDPTLNLDLGQFYVEHLLESSEINGGLFMLVAAYNAGPSAAKRWYATIRHGGDPLMFIEALPRSETRDFVEQVLTNFWIYRAKLGQKSPSKEDLMKGRWPTYVAMDTPETKAAEATSWPVSTKP